MTGIDDLTRVRTVADAVLYEGYLLYPYRSTSGKNQSRWQFGVLGPVGAADRGAGEDAAMRANFAVEMPAERRFALLPLLEIDPDRFADVHGTTDTETLFHLALTLGLEDDPAGALARAIGTLASALPRSASESPSSGCAVGERPVVLAAGRVGILAEFFRPPALGRFHRLHR